MARGANQKLKLLYLSKIMKEMTDDEHSLTMPQIIAELNKYGIDADRKSVYDDIAVLNDFGIDIIKEQIGRYTYYHCGNRDFEIAELKFLVDAIQSSKFISEKKTEELIRKLENTVSIYDARLLAREVNVSGRVKNMNESIYYTIDAIHNAMIDNKRIRFRYFSWNIKGEEEFRHDGAFYEVSPWMLQFDDEKYYLVAYDSKTKMLRHYRVDKMRDVSAVDKKRQGVTEYKKQNKAKYTMQHFRMYGGEIETVTLLCKNEIANVIVDQFGRDVKMLPVDDEHFRVRVDVAVSGQFFGWVFSLGGDVRIEGPERVKDRFGELMKREY